MKKTFGIYAIAWALLLGLFNAISFLVPFLKTDGEYTNTFWIGYALITACFVGQLLCAALAFKADTLQKFFYNISLVKVSYTGLILSLVVGGLCMLIGSVAYWIGVIVCAIVLVVNIIAVLKAKVAADAISAVDQKIKVQTFFIKSLTVDADSLMARANGDEAREACKKVYEAVRYSDPMSHEALAATESQITLSFGAFSKAVEENDAAGIEKLSNELVILIGDRNKKCKLLK